MEANGLSVAPDKSEAMLLVERRTIREMSVRTEGRAIESQEAVGYLGMENGCGSPGRLLPTLGGPRESKRRVLCSVVHGILLYGAEAWIDGYRKQKYRQMLLGIQRTMVLRVCYAYRRVSGEALCVLAGVPPLDLLAEERLCERKRRKNEREADAESRLGKAANSELS